jgi:hypothetical protein
MALLAFLRGPFPQANYLYPAFSPNGSQHGWNIWPGQSFGFIVPGNLPFAGRPGAFAFAVPARWGKNRAVVAMLTPATPSGLAPTVVSVAANNGPAAGGNTVIITGTHFIGATGITFGGVPVPFFVVTGTNTVQVTVPPHAAGVVDVVVTTATGGAGTGLGVYTYT